PTTPTTSGVKKKKKPTTVPCPCRPRQQKKKKKKKPRPSPADFIAGDSSRDSPPPFFFKVFAAPCSCSSSPSPSSSSPGCGTCSSSSPPARSVCRPCVPRRKGAPRKRSGAWAFPSRKGRLASPRRLLTAPRHLLHSDRRTGLLVTTQDLRIDLTPASLALAGDLWSAPSTFSVAVVWTSPPLPASQLFELRLETHCVTDPLVYLH
ncbi:hypothetical protein U9M48_028564, partial [Paspalum notatum var. saurae]